MALQGTLKDFGLADILQLIGIQRKTGILTLNDGREKVAIKFLKGSVVGAETGSGGVEERLGQVLVRTGKITAQQLQQALKQQKRTLQRLGHLLVHSDFISEEELVEALRVQSLQVIYRLFRWRDAKYHVDLMDSIEYDEAHFAPISAETILMEGARMIDEWPIIERRIKSDKMILARTEAADEVGTVAEPAPAADLEFEFIFRDETASAADPAAEGAEVQLSREEQVVLALVDGSRSVEEINDHSELGDFDTYRVLSELVTRDLIKEVRKVSSAAPDARSALGVVERAFRAVLVAGVLVVSAGSLATLEWNPVAPWKVSGQAATTDRLRFFASLARLERLEQAVHVTYLSSGVYPTDLETLASGGIVAPADLIDPWGRPYGFSVSPGGYQLFGLDGQAEPHPELSRSHRFSATEQMMLPNAGDEL